MELLDRALGELLPGMPLVVTGPVGAGRTVLCLQIASQALTKQHCVVYITSEPHAILLQQADSLGLELRSAVVDGRLILLELEPHAPALLQSASADALLEAIAEEGAPQTLIWDPINTLVGEFIDESDLRAALGSLLAGPPGAPPVVVATAERSLLEQQPLIWRGLSDLCGALVELVRSDHGSREFKVVKTRFGGEIGSFPYAIGPGGLLPVAPGAAQASPAPDGAVQPAGPVASAAPAPSGAPGDSVPAPAPAGPEPATASHLPAPPAAGAPASRGSDPPPRILIVDACEADRASAAEWLSDYEVSQASSSFEALASVLASRPDLVLLDPDLADASGRELLASLRGASLRVPVLVQSTRAARQADRVGLLVIGAADVLPKPPNRFELRRKIETLMRLPPEEPIPGADDDPAVVELLTSKRRKVRDPEMRARIERAAEFGDSYGIPSTLVALEADWEEGPDALVAAAEAALRAEDALLVRGERRMLVLLVAASMEQAEAVMGRIARRAAPKDDEEPPPFAAHYVPVARETAKVAWKRLFEDVAPEDGEPEEDGQ